MLRTAFIGNENAFNHKMCEWLSLHTDLSLIIWTNVLTWSSGKGSERRKKVIQRFVHRAKRYGRLRAANELLYFAVYRVFLANDEQSRLRNLVNSFNFDPKTPISEIEQIRPDNIKSEELLRVVREQHLDAMFAMCIDVYLPKELIHAPRFGTFLWHEGITPDYRGMHSPFWTLANKDYDNLGYTLLKMNAKWDAGEIYVQGKAQDIDFMRDWHCYIGHKSIFDSLPQVEKFLTALEGNKPCPIERPNAADVYYSYPTGSELLKILFRRNLATIFGRTRTS